MTSISDALIDASLLDFSKTCRLCLHQGTELSQLFSESENADTSITSLPSKIMACVSIEVSPENNMPKQICTKCLQQVDNWVKFKELCDSANALLQQCLANLQPSSAEDAEVTKRHETDYKKGSLIEDSRNKVEEGLFVIMQVDKKAEQKHDENCNIDDNGYKNVNECNDWAQTTQNIKTLTNNIRGKPNKNLEKKDNIIINNSIDKIKYKLESKTSWKDKKKKTTKIKKCDSIGISEEGEKVKIEKVKSKWKSRYDRFQKKHYVCGLTNCNKFFSRFCDLIQHDRTDHNDVPLESICHVCGRIFVSEDRLQLHTRTYHAEKKFECDICAGKFVSKDSLRYHKKKHSGRWVCDVCGLMTSSNIMLEEHKRKHTGEKPFVCDYCGRTFATNTTLKSHRHSHTKETNYKCDLCGYTSRNQSSVYMHKKTHSLDKPCICETCGARFKLQARLAEHRKIHFADKKHSCHLCSMSFLTKYQLTVHIRTHSGERPYSCETCNKRFTRSDGLKEHLRTHTKEKKYTCTRCVKPFSFLKSLKNHKCSPNGS